MSDDEFKAITKEKVEGLIADRALALGQLRLARTDRQDVLDQLQSQIDQLNAALSDANERLKATEEEGLLPSVIQTRKKLAIAAEQRRLADALTAEVDAQAKLDELMK